MSTGFHWDRSVGSLCLDIQRPHSMHQFIAVADFYLKPFTVINPVSITALLSSASLSRKSSNCGYKKNYKKDLCTIKTKVFQIISQLKPWHTLKNNMLLKGGENSWGLQDLRWMKLWVPWGFLPHISYTWNLKSRIPKSTTGTPYPQKKNAVTKICSL